MDLSNKRIIMIHGLASKPSKKDLDELWTRSLVENIRVDNAPVAEALEQSVGVFDTVYWANETPHHIEDDKKYVDKLNVQVNKVIAERQRIKDAFHVGGAEKVSAFFRNRGADVVKLLAGALTIKDDVMKGFLREVELYEEDQYIADKTRSHLENALSQAWDDNCEVALLSHSMGTIIAYDVLWCFSHRNKKSLRKYRDKKIQLFATMGSPLGDPTVRGLLFSRFHKNNGKRPYPTNIERWHNYACLGDLVAYQHDFKNAFFDDMHKVDALPVEPDFCTKNYVNLHNPFEVVTHEGNKDKEKRNPHKSYGYLVQPKLGMWLTAFLEDKLR